MNDLPPICLRKIASYLDDLDLLNFQRLSHNIHQASKTVMGTLPLYEIGAKEYDNYLKRSWDLFDHLTFYTANYGFYVTKNRGVVKIFHIYLDLPSTASNNVTNVSPFFVSDLISNDPFYTTSTASSRSSVKREIKFSLIQTFGKHYPNSFIRASILSYFREMMLTPHDVYLDYPSLYTVFSLRKCCCEVDPDYPRKKCLELNRKMFRSENFYYYYFMGFPELISTFSSLPPSSFNNEEGEKERIPDENGKEMIRLILDLQILPAWKYRREKRARVISPKVTSTELSLYLVSISNGNLFAEPHRSQEMRLFVPSAMMAYLYPSCLSSPLSGKAGAPALPDKSQIGPTIPGTGIVGTRYFLRHTTNAKIFRGKPYYVLESEPTEENVMKIFATHSYKNIIWGYHNYLQIFSLREGDCRNNHKYPEERAKEVILTNVKTTNTQTLFEKTTHGFTTVERYNLVMEIAFFLCFVCHQPLTNFATTTSPPNENDYHQLVIRTTNQFRKLGYH